MIDKSLSQYYDSKYNIENRRRYFTGAYGGGGGKSGGNGSADRGGRAHQAAAEKAQTAARDASADRGGQAQKAAAEKAQKAARDARDTAREKAIEVAAKTVKTETKSPHRDTKEQVKEQKELDIARDWEFQDVKAKPKVPTTTKKAAGPFDYLQGPKPKTETTTVHGKDDQVFTIIRPKKISPTYYQDRSKIGGKTWGERAEQDMKRGFFDSGIGKILKWGGTLLAPQLLGPKFGSLMSKYKTAKTVSKYAKDLGLTKKDVVLGLRNKVLDKNLSLASTQHLKSRPKGMPEHLGERGFRTTETSREGEGDNIVQQVAGDKDVISESIKKYTLTDDQKTEANRRRSMVQEILNQGAYQGNELTAQQRDQLTNYIAQIDRYLVDPTQYIAQGGRIDSPLTGGSRYI